MIELLNIRKTYQMGEAEVHALDGVSAAINDGEFVAVIGPSGSGKSTLMNIIGCLDLADGGEYRLNGQLIDDYTERQLGDIRNREIGFIFQQFNLLPKLTAYENVELPLIYQGLPMGERKRRVLESLEKVGLANRMSHKPSELSGGQQQRVAIARAIATRPTLILADEPTGNLDSHSGQEIMAILTELNREGRGILLITHDNDIANMADRQLQMRDGRIEHDKRSKNNKFSDDPKKEKEAKHEKGDKKDKNGKKEKPNKLDKDKKDKGEKNKKSDKKKKDDSGSINGGEAS